MRHLKLAAILGFVLLTTGQLTLHNHSLIPEAGQPAVVCGVCAFSADPAMSATPNERPLVFVCRLDPVDASIAASGTLPLLPSRAPPAAA